LEQKCIEGIRAESKYAITAIASLHSPDDQKFAKLCKVGCSSGPYRDLLLYFWMLNPLLTFFFLEHVGELRIFILRENNWHYIKNKARTLFKMLCFMNDGSLCSSCCVFTKPLHNLFHMTLINFPFKLTQLCLSYFLSHMLASHSLQGLRCCLVYVVWSQVAWFMWSLFTINVGDKPLLILLEISLF
jgi:hypothetical protein